MRGDWSVTTRSKKLNMVALVLALALVVTVPVWAQQQPSESGSSAQAEKKAQTEEKKAEPAKKPAPARSAAGQGSSRQRGGMQLRDPFVAQVAGGGSGPGGPAVGRQLPPGIRGLVVSQVMVGGIVLGDRGKIAVVQMPGSGRAHFIREGDRLYDGVVKEIRGDRVIFRERSRDVFGNVKVRDVEKVLTSLMEGSNRSGARR